MKGFTMWKNCVFTVLVAVLVLTTSVQAEQIGVNFGNLADTALAPTDVAGVPEFEQSNWNGTTGLGNTGTLNALVDASGTATTMSVTWSTNNVQNSDEGNTSTPNHKMMKEYLDNRPTEAGKTVVTITGIPYSNYALIIYREGQNRSASRNGKYTISNSDGSAVIAGPYYAQDPADSDFEGVFIQAPLNTTIDDATTPSGNYLLIEELSDASIQIEAIGSWRSDSEQNARGAFNAFQIVEMSSAGALNPAPSNNETQVDPAVVSQLTWEAPLTKNDPEGDPNLVSVDQFDLTIYSVLTDDVAADDPNFVGVTTYTDVTSPYAISLDYDRTYFWRVDTHVTWDSNEFTGTPSLSEIVTGSNWQFATKTAAPIITQQPIDIRTLTGPDAVFTCQFSSASVPTEVAWYEVGNATPISTGFVDEGSNNYSTTLTIASTLANEGEYYCTIDNGTLVQSDNAYLIINQLLARYTFDDTLAPTVDSLADAPTGQGMTIDGLAEPNEADSTPISIAYDTGVDGMAVLLDPNDFVDFTVAGYPKAGSFAGGIGRGLDIGTIMYWVKPQTNGAIYGTFNNGTVTGVLASLTGTNPTQARVYVRGENADNTAGMVLANNITGMPDRPGWDIFDNEWHMIALTWEAGVDVKVYVDGQLAAAGNAGTPAQFMPWNRNVLLGASRTTADRNILNSLFSGMIDDLRIYNYRLDADGEDAFAQEYFDNTGIRPCLDSNFDGSEYNFDNTGSSYCVLNLADFAEFAKTWLANGLWDAP